MRVLLVAAAYCIAGRAALLLAIPPGYASAIWPAAGIALAATLAWGPGMWPGIVTGSFFVNIWTYHDGSSPARAAISIAIALAIAIGAALQASAGAFLIRRFVGFPAVPGRESKVVALLGLGGPVSCLINGCVGTFTLLACHLITPPLIAFTWWTWWVGDTLGVLIVMPLVLIGWSTPQADRRRRFLTVAAPLLAFSIMMLMVFFYASRIEARRISNDFRLRTERLAEQVRGSLDADVEVLYGIKSLYESTPRVTRAAFRRFVSRALARRPEFQALEWVPRVPEEDRRAFEADARADGLPGFHIWGEHGGEARIHFPVDYVEPARGNDAAIGYDLATEPVRHAALERARDTGTAAATGSITLVQENARQHGALVVLPIYSRESGTAEERRRNLLGFALGVFRIGDMVSAALAGRDQEGIALHLIDASAPPENALLCSMRSGRMQDFEERAAPFAVESSLPFAGRTWEMRFTPSAEYPFTHKSWGAWAVLAVGLLFTSLLGAFLLVITGRTAIVEQLVRERTAQLSETTEALQKAHGELETRVQQRTADLSRALGERDTFISIASHELKTPLTSMQLRLQALSRASTGGAASFLEHLRGYLPTAERQIGRLSRLVNDLLDVSRIGAGRLHVEMEELDLAALLREVVNRLEPEAARARSAVSVDAPGSLALRSDRLRLEQVITNLLENAVKYGQGRPVEVRLDGGPDEVVLSVVDHGIGIRAQDLSRIFERFERAVSERNYSGLGLGLYIARTVVEALGGRIWAESRPGEETRFTVRLPRGRATPALGAQPAPASTPHGG